jgi:branched-chain amino acid transport system substrate-binding protein
MAFKVQALAAGLLVATTVTSIAVAQNADTQGVTDKEIKIGFFGPFGGPAYLYGKISMNGAEAVFDKVNSAGGIHGRKLVLIREDDGCKAEQAIGAVKKLAYEEKVFAMMGGACSNSTVAARPEIEKSGVPFILNSATADGITDPPAANIFTTQTTGSVESRAQLDYALSHGAKKIALAVMKDAWGMSRYTPFMKYLEEKKVQLVENVELAGDAVDATPQALKLKASGADAVILILYPKPAAVMMRDSLKLGYNPTWIGQSTISDLKAFGGQVGMPTALDHFVTISSTRFDPSNPQLKEWEDRVKKLFPNDELSPFNFYGLGSALVLVEVLNRVGPNPTRSKFLDELGKLKNFKSEAYFGPITCNAPANHQCNQHPGWFAWKNNSLVEVQ